MRLAATITLSALAATLAFGAAPVQTEKVDRKEAAPVQATAVNVASGYQLTAFSIGGVQVHSLRIEGDLASGGQLFPDPNGCGLNEFGDPTICTMAFLPAQRFTFEKVGIQDPAEQGRRLYQLQGLGSTNEVFLVVPGNQSGPYRLIQKNPTGQHITLLTLTRVSS